MNIEKIEEMLNRLVDASAVVAHAEGIYAAGARRELDEALAAVKARMLLPIDNRRWLGGTPKPCEKYPDRYCNCSFYPACRDEPGPTAGDPPTTNGDTRK